MIRIRRKTFWFGVPRDPRFMRVLTIRTTRGVWGEWW